MLCAEPSARDSAMQQLGQAMQTPNALSVCDWAQGEPVWDERIFERAAHKGRIGSPKSATPFLRGQFLAPPGRETTSKLRELRAADVPFGEAWSERRGHPGGLDVLRQRCTKTAVGRMQPAIAQLWNAAWRVLFMVDGNSVRPVAHGEAFFKFAMATCVAACHGAIDQAYGPSQCGARKHDGAGQMIAQVSAALVLAPDEAMVCTDATNAVASVLRSPIWLAAVDVRPRPAGVPQNLCGANHTMRRALGAGGIVVNRYMHRGAGRGGPERLPLRYMLAGAQGNELRRWGCSSAYSAAAVDVWGRLCRPGTTWSSTSCGRKLRGTVRRGQR